MFMKNDGDKKLSEITEQIIDIVCLAASFGILFLLPHKIDFFFYLIFGISAFLFCVGFFRLGFTIKVPAVSGWTFFTGIFFALSGVIINIVGLYEIWRDHGSGRSITIATLLLIEALLFFAIAGGSAKTTVRTIDFLSVHREGAEVIIKVHGNAFLYNMVRIIAGTLIGIGQGKLPPECLGKALTSLNRLDLGVTAPACGLELTRVEYDFDREQWWT